MKTTNPYEFVDPEAPNGLRIKPLRFIRWAAAIGFGLSFVLTFLTFYITIVALSDFTIWSIDFHGGLVIGKWSLTYATVISACITIAAAIGVGMKGVALRILGRLPRP